MLDVTAVLSEEFHVPSHQDTETLSKLHLQDAAEHVMIEQDMDNLVYANSEGHGILADLKNMKMDIKILMAKDEHMTRMLDKQQTQLNEHQKQLNEHQRNIYSLQSHVKLLVQSSEGYRSVRRQFIDVYKRDIQGSEEFQGSKAIREGNQIAHKGDALGDAALFDRDQRTDRSTYRELYGLDHQQVLDFSTYTDG